MKAQRDLFDLDAGLAGRDEGLARVTAHNPDFAAAHHLHVVSLPSGWEGTNEDIRAIWQGPWPHHHNAWGAAWKDAIDRNLLIKTPRFVAMRARKAHGRRTQVYRRV